MSTVRKPKRRMIGTAVTFMNSAPAALVKVSMPEAKGLSPNTSCSSIASRNGNAPMPMRNSPPPIVATAKVGISINFRLMIGIFDAPRVHHVERRAYRAAAR